MIECPQNEVTWLLLSGNSIKIRLLQVALTWHLEKLLFLRSVSACIPPLTPR